MTFHFDHGNVNVTDVDKSIAFYQEALGLTPSMRWDAPDGHITIVYLTDGKTDFKLELTWLRDFSGAYALGDNKWHLCLKCDDYEGALAKHRAMGCIDDDSEAGHIYFIKDPDGNRIELLRA